MDRHEHAPIFKRLEPRFAGSALCGSAVGNALAALVA